MSRLRTLVLVLVTALYATAAAAQQVEEPFPGSLFNFPSQDALQQLELGLHLMHPEYIKPSAGFAARKYTYIIQDDKGAVQGWLQSSFEPLTDRERPLIRLRKKYSYPLTAESTLIVDWLTLDPVTLDLRLYDAGDSVPPENAEPSESYEVSYYYDTATVQLKGSEVGAVYSLRRPLPSYDLDELLLLLSVTRVEDLPEKSALLLTAPLQNRNHAVLVEKLGRVAIYAADAERHVCLRLRLSFYDSVEEYFVETLPPHRVIKFTTGKLTFTLQDDLTEFQPDSEETEKEAKLMGKPL